MKPLFEYLISNKNIAKSKHFEANPHLAKLYEYVINANLDSSRLSKYEEGLSKMFDIANNKKLANNLFELIISLIESGEYSINCYPNERYDDNKTIMFDYDKKKDRARIFISKTKSNWVIIFMKDTEYAAKKYDEGRICDYWAQCWHTAENDSNSMFYTSEWLDYEDYSIKALDNILKGKI